MGKNREREDKEKIYKGIEQPLADREIPAPQTAGFQ